MRGTETRSVLCPLLAATFAACVFGANWAITHLGTADSHGVHTIPVGFGWRSPSGVVFVGLSLTIRDALQRSCGLAAATAAIAIGSGLTLFVAPSLAVASAVAFLFAELADLAVFTPLRERSTLGAVVLSNTVGALVDSALFLSIAFGVSAVPDFALPQVVGKMEWSLVALPFILFRARDRRRAGGGARP